MTLKQNLEYIRTQATSIKTAMKVTTILIAFFINLLHVPLLYGTFGGLVLTVILQVYLPGYLLARLLGKLVSNPISRFVWILACGLGMTITIGAAARLLDIGIPVYLVILYAITVVLALLPAPEAEGMKFQVSIKGYILPLYVLVFVCSIIVFGVSYESRNRFYGFEDQSIFISLIDWLVHHPDVHPHDLPLRSRQIGIFNGDERFDIDGWTYNQAAWSWVSGVTGAQLNWYDIGALFIWCIPLIAFALAYEITGSMSVGAFSSLGLTIAGLFTLDNLVYNPTYTAYGRMAVFQINAVRQASITVVLPLALMSGLSYVRCPSKSSIILVFLMGMALAAMHPVQVTIFVMSIFATILLLWFSRPSRQLFLHFLPLTIMLSIFLTIPFVQRLLFFGSNVAPTLAPSGAESSAVGTSSGYFVTLQNLPILGTSYVRNPSSFFYHPIIILVVLLGLLLGLEWRRKLAAQYIFGTTLLAIVLSFTPILTEKVNEIASFVTLLLLIFLLPVPLIIGIGINYLWHFMSRCLWVVTKFLSGDVNKPANTKVVTEIGVRSITTWCIVLIAVTILAELLFEPIPMQASGRDQIIAFNDAQTVRQLRPSQMALAKLLKEIIPANTITTMMVPPDVDNVVLEELPGALITGGRDQGINTSAKGNSRFFSIDPETSAPWLDSVDLDFIKRWDVTHIITLADSSRSPQLMFDTKRFKLLDSVAGYLIFEVNKDLEIDETDEIFNRMNTAYSANREPRWKPGDFRLAIPGTVTPWTDIASVWQTLLSVDASNERAKLGLAFAYTFLGDDSKALALWRELNQRYESVYLYAEAVASVMRVINPAGEYSTSLITALSHADANSRVLAARKLLTEDFFYQLRPENIQRIFEIAEDDFLVWDRLANFDQPESVRQRAALLMYAGYWGKANEWLRVLPKVVLSPEDFTALAATALAQGDVEGALKVLQPTTDTDWTRANSDLHPDRWENNTAAQMYYLLSGEIDRREGRDATRKYLQAINFGAQLTGNAFLNSSEYPQLNLGSLLRISETGHVYVMDPEVVHGNTERALRVTATYGDLHPRNTFPVLSWQVSVLSLDGKETYAQVEKPANLVDGALVREETGVVIEKNIPQLTQALVYIQPRHNNQVVARPVIVPVVLNRPDSSDISPETVFLEKQFGDFIILKGYSVDEISTEELRFTLYWSTSSELKVDYHVFVHLVDTNGNIVTQVDSMPVKNRYPTSQWRTEVTISDQYSIAFDAPLPVGHYSVRIGMYRLSDMWRLPVAPEDSHVTDDGLRLFEFSR